ncbi:MAG: BACON domain-containing protein, partial [Planctomycetota bacterium]
MNSFPRGTAAVTASVALLLLLSRTGGAAVKFKSSKELAAPVLACEPTEIRLVLASDNAASFVFTVMNTGGRTLDWKVQSCPTWLTLEPRRGSLGQGRRQKITLRVDAKGLRPGLATEGVVAIGSGAGTGPLKIKVGVEVLAAAPVRAVERAPVRDVAEPAPDGVGYEQPLPILPPSGGLVLDDIELMVGRGTQPGAFVGVGARIRDAEFG